MKFIIWCWDYHKFVGGVRIQHKLCHLLNELGHEAYITAKNTNPLWNTPTYDGSGFDKENTVVIYPECISENLLDAKHVVRWLLFHQIADYNPNDYIFKLFDHYVSKDNICHGILKVLDYDLKPWYDRNLERPYNMVCLRKGIWKKSYPIDSSLRFHFIQDEIEKEYKDENLVAYCMNRSKYYVCYDESSFIPIQAALCGCIPIVIPAPYYTADQWRENFPAWKYGIAYGFSKDEINHAISTNHLIRDHVESFNDNYDSVKEFVKFWENKLQ